MAGPKVFVREATGLVREWSSIDGFIYNALAGPLLSTAFVLAFSWVPFIFQGADMLLAIGFGLIAFIPVGVTYAMMTASLPRSGGDYVFQSRALHPAIGFMNGWTYLFIMGGFYAALVGAILSYSVLAPTLAVLGVTTQNLALQAAGDWFAGRTGAFVVTVVTVVFANAINFGGMRLYARTQRIAMLIGLIGLIIMIWIFASSTNSQFIKAFNGFAMAYTSDPDAYNSMITASTQAGFVTSPKTSIVQSFMAVTVMAFGFTGIIWSAENAGEIKNAHSFKSQVFQIVGSLLFGAVLLAILAAVLYPTVGSGFLAATGYLFFTGNSAYPIPIAPYFPLYAVILNPNAIGAAFILLWGVLWIFYPVSNAPLAGSRFLLAASFDRTLPSKFATVSERFHVPSFALILMTLVMLILGALYVFVPDIGAATAAGIFAMMIMELCTCISAAIFPYRMKEAYKSSVVSKYKIAGIPLMSITGAVSVVFLLWLVYVYATMSELGVNSTLSAIFLLVVFVSGIIVYYVAKAYRKRQGIDLNLVFREVPPE